MVIGSSLQVRRSLVRWVNDVQFMTLDFRPRGISTSGPFASIQCSSICKHVCLGGKAKACHEIRIENMSWRMRLLGARFVNDSFPVPLKTLTFTSQKGWKEQPSQVCGKFVQALLPSCLVQNSVNQGWVGGSFHFDLGLIVPILGYPRKQGP